MFDLVIQGGTVVDGNKTDGFKADVGIVRDRIVKIGAIDANVGRQVIDARGKAVAPGFVDVHTHADGWLLREKNFFSKTSQGFTTEVLLADGISYAPVNRHTARDWMYYMRTLNGLRFEAYEGWGSIADYMVLLDRRTAQNTIPHVPYANVRSLACGFGRPTPDDVQMNHILDEIHQGMDAGAVGLSTGLDYIVEFWATTDELIEACSALRPYGGLYVTHIRYKKGVIGGLKEAVEIGKRARVPVQISHSKRGGQGQTADNPDGKDLVMEYINNVAVNEVDFSFDVYPYMASSTMLNSLFPPEVWRDGPLGVFGHLRRPEIATRARTALKGINLDATHIAWLPSKQNSHYQGQSLRAYCDAVGGDEIEALTNLLIEENLAVLLVFSLGDDRQIDAYLQHPNYMMGSDGIYQPGGVVHPRHFGSGTRLIGRCVRDWKLFSLEEAVWKMTGAPAARFGLTERGQIREGYFADVVVFDPETVTDHATIENPQQLSTGVEWVFVNGEVIVAEGRPVVFEGDAPGRALRYGG